MGETGGVGGRSLCSMRWGHACLLRAPFESGFFEWMLSGAPPAPHPLAEASGTTGPADARPSSGFVPLVSTDIVWAEASGGLDVTTSTLGGYNSPGLSL